MKYLLTLALLFTFTSLSFADESKDTVSTKRKTAVWIDVSLLTLAINRDVSLNIVTPDHHIRLQAGDWGVFEIMSQEDNFQIMSASYLFTKHKPGSYSYFYAGAGIGYMTGTTYNKCSTSSDGFWGEQTYCRAQSVDTGVIPITVGATFGSNAGISIEIQTMLNPQAPVATIKVGLPLGYF